MRRILCCCLAVGTLLLALGCGKGFAPIPMQRPRKTVAPAPMASTPARSSPAQIGAAAAPAESTARSTPPAELPLAPTAEKAAETKATLIEVKAEAADGQEVLHSDSFADVLGSIHWNRNGVKSAEGPAGKRTVYFFNDKPEDGTFVMKTLEDAETHGADDKPGVLALGWPEIPGKLAYSGFTYLGGIGDARMKLPVLQAVKSAEELRPIRLSFRFKGINKTSDKPVTLTIGCRLEPMLTDPYNKRIDLGTIKATDEWGTFEKPLADGKNLEAFLRALADEKPAAFKIVWAQSGPITGYRAGDTLLLDDVKIVKAKPTEQ